MAAQSSQGTFGYCDCGCMLSRLCGQAGRNTGSELRTGGFIAQALDTLAVAGTAVESGSYEMPVLHCRVSDEALAVWITDCVMAGERMGFGMVVL